MKYQFKVPPSKTEQTVSVTIPDLPTSVAPTITGTTPIDPTQPPVDPPPPTPGNYGTLIYSTNFDSPDDLDPYDTGQLANGKLVNGMFESIPANVSSGTRSEIQYPSSITPQEGVIEYDVKYEVIIPSDCHSLQFHPNTSGGSASPGLWHDGGKFVWKNWINGQNQVHNLTSDSTIQQNRLYRMRIEFKFGSSGYFRHYIDDKLVCSWTGQVGDNSGQYFKLGFNGGWGSSANTAKNSRIYYDSLKIWKK